MSENTISDEYEIDEDIRDLVEFCNNNGIKTLASCSGTIKDHGELKGSGQLMIEDSEISRKIAAIIIERGICDADLIGRIVESYELYGNIIAGNRINFSFDNPNNDILPKIEEVFHQVVTREVEPDIETLEKVNQIFDFFNSIDRKINSSYSVENPKFAGEFTFNASNISSLKRVDKERVTENLVRTTGKSRVDHTYYMGIIMEGNENLEDILSKAKNAIKNAPEISKRVEERRDRAREKAVWERLTNNAQDSETICKTSQPLSELLGLQINTPEEIARMDAENETKTNRQIDVTVEPWEKL